MEQLAIGNAKNTREPVGKHGIAADHLDPASNIDEIELSILQFPGCNIAPPTGCRVYNRRYFAQFQVFSKFLFGKGHNTRVVGWDWRAKRHARMIAFEDKYFVGLCGHRRNLPLLRQAELDQRVSGLIREIRRKGDELLDITWAFTEHLTVALDPGMC